MASRQTTKKRTVRKKAATRKSARPTAAAKDKLAGISSASVEKATGKPWAAWLAALDKAGAAKLAHAEIAEMLATKFGVGPWWSQMVTVGYEQARGLRAAHQTTRGYQVSASKTVNVPVAVLYKAWSMPRARAAWMPDEFTVRTATANRSMRISWPDGTNVDVNFAHKGAAKSSVSVQCDKLKSAADVSKKRAFWKARLESLKAEIED